MTVIALRSKLAQKKRSKTMEIVLTLPDEVAANLQNGGSKSISRSVLELIAVDGYKSGKLSHVAVGRLLNLETPVDVDGFLKEHDVYNVDYTDEELTRQEEVSHHLASLHTTAK